MPFSTTSVFGEPDDFRVALRSMGNVNLYVTGYGEFLARLTKINLFRIRLATVVETLPRIGFLAVPPDTVLVTFPIGDQPPPIWGGIQPRTGEIMTCGPDHGIHMRTQGPCRWCAIWLPLRTLLEYFRDLTENTLTIAHVAQLWCPSRIPRGRLQQLHAAAIRAVEVRPETIVAAEAAHGMEQQLVDALVKCLSTGPLPEQPRSGRQNDRIVVKFEKLLQTRPKGALGEEALGGALGVSSHNLRAICKEELGMSPTNYIRLRALHSVHDILDNGLLDQVRVSEVARDHGFRDLGRFAASYRSLFGQLPSVTSRRAINRCADMRLA